MQDVIPDLWPDEITRTEVPTPLAILRIQANNLRAKTKGIIEAEVRCLVDREKKREIYHFEIVANDSCRALMEVQLESGIPIANGVLTCEDDDQALARMQQKGSDCAQAAVEIANLLRSLAEIT